MTRIVEFYASDEDLQMIHEEQKRYSGSGISLSESEAIRSMLLRASTDADQPGERTNPNEEMSESAPAYVLHGRGDKLFVS
jgi:hypothetical protein